MNDLQRQLSDLLKASVGDPPERVTVQAVRRRRARRHLVAAAGAAVAIAVVAAVSVGVSGRLGHPSPATSPTVAPAPVPCRPGWSVGAGAAPAGDSGDSLSALAGSASDDLWAVGSRSPHHSQKVFPLLEHWDGRRWTYSAGASLSGRQAMLKSVAAPASDDVWAIGSFMPAGRPLIEHWNGRYWSLQPTDALSRWKSLSGETLVSVAALSPSDVWVLGYPNTNSPDDKLHWDGTSWHLFTGPDIRPNFGSAAMQVIGTDRDGGFWAVGGTIRGDGEAGRPGRGIVERWNGRQWEVDKRYGWKEPLTMVAPITPDDVWAIAGGYFMTSGTYGISPIEVLHWNGSTWRLALNLGGTPSVDPIGIGATSANDAYVIGRSARTYRPFIDRWDGTRWQSIPLGPAGPAHHSGFDGESLTVTSDGSIAALDSPGLTDRTNYLWLKC